MVPPVRKVSRQDEAIDLLARLLKTVYQGSVTPEGLKNSPEWDPLRVTDPSPKGLQSTVKDLIH